MFKDLREVGKGGPPTDNYIPLISAVLFTPRRQPTPLTRYAKYCLQNSLDFLLQPSFPSLSEKLNFSANKLYR